MSSRQLILFDLLTALMDSWTVWNETAGSEIDGKKWRMCYLKKTYGCGAYRAYETLVEESAVESGFPSEYATKLTENWMHLRPWPGVVEALTELKKTHRLGVVTNCSKRLGHLAAGLVGVPFDIVVTSDEAGFYKPDPRPYEMAMRLAGVTAKETLFVSGSCYDLLGTEKLGLPCFWHNHIGMVKPDGFIDPVVELPTIDGLVQAIRDFEARES